MNRPGRKRELEVRAMFEPNRLAEQCLAVAYERVVPINRRPTGLTTDKHERNNRKVAWRAGGVL